MTHFYDFYTRLKSLRCFFILDVIINVGNIVDNKEERLLFMYIYTLHGPPMLVDKTKFGLVLYNHANIYRFDEPSSYWSVKRISVFPWFSLVNQRHTRPASQCITVQWSISEMLCGPCIAAIIWFPYYTEDCTGNRGLYRYLLISRRSEIIGQCRNCNYNSSQWHSCTFPDCKEVEMLFHPRHYN